MMMATCRGASNGDNGGGLLGMGETVQTVMISFSFVPRS
jgi:hypothetical protein